MGASSRCTWESYCASKASSRGSHACGRVVSLSGWTHICLSLSSVITTDSCGLAEPGPPCMGAPVEPGPWDPRRWAVCGAS